MHLKHHKDNPCDICDFLITNKTRLKHHKEILVINQCDLCNHFIHIYAPFGYGQGSCLPHGHVFALVLRRGGWGATLYSL